MNFDIKILIVDDEEIFTSILHYLLSPNYTVYVANSGHEAIEMAKETVPDLILLDVVMPDISGFDVFRELKKSESTQNIPVIFITGLNSTEEEEQGFFLGAIDYITKPFINSIVTARVRTHVQVITQIRTIEQKCLIDALTNLPNRRSFDERFANEWGRAIRDEKPLGLLFIDVDKFKHFNDTYGHPFGDSIIQKTGEIYKNSLKRSTDFVARWGGDEFVILLPGTDFDGSCTIAARLNKNTENESIPCPGGGTVTATISIGVNSIRPTPADDPGVFIDNTDKALYAAKESGRNRFCSYDDYLNLRCKKPEKEPEPEEVESRNTAPVVSVSVPVAEEQISQQTQDYSPLLERLRGIPGLEADRAIAAIGGSVELYTRILSVVIDSIPQNLVKLDESLFSARDLKTFCVKIHGMKGSLKQIGHHDLSALAEALEHNSRAGNKGYCLEKYPAFKDDLTVFYKQASGTDYATVNTPAHTAKKDAAENRTKILVVDDNPANLTLISGLLGGLYKVISVNSGESALKFLKKQIPDLILLDVEMPGMDGKEVFAAIKADPRLADIPIIFITGLNDMESEAESIAMGIDDYMRKPVNGVIMLHRVKMQLELKKLRSNTKY